jgi:NADH:ubiquinone oxidoreductase subunit K
MDWNTTLPYTLIASIALIGIGLYAIITGKKFIRAVFGLEILFLASILLLLSFGLGSDESTLIPDPLAHVFSLILIVVSIVFLIIGISIDKRLRQSGDSTLVEFNFFIDDVQMDISSDSNLTEVKNDMNEN